MDDLIIKVHGDFIEVRHPENYRIDAEKMESVWAHLGEVCREHNCHRVLVDAEMPRREMKTIDAFASGIRLSEIGEPILLALCFGNYQPDDLSEFFKTVVRNRGGLVEFFSNRSDALKWLGVKDDADGR